MVTMRNSVFNCAANFLRGRKCIFCGSFNVYKTRRGYVKCGKCNHQESLKQLRKEIAIITGFYQLQPAYRLAIDLGIDYQSVTRVYHRVREAIYHVAELEARPDEVLHRVILRCNFYMSETEVTQGQYLDVMDTNPSWYNGNSVSVRPRA